MKISKLLVIGLFSIAIVGCKTKAETPEQSFNRWLKSIESCDVEGIKGGLTKATREVLDQMVEQFSKAVIDQSGKKLDIYADMCKVYQPGSAVFVSEKISENGQEAEIVYTKDGSKLEAPMLMEEGRWRLDIVGMMARISGASSPVPEAAAGEAAPAAEAPAPAAGEAAPAAEGPGPAAEAPAPAAEGEAAPAAEGPGPAAEAPAAAGEAAPAAEGPGPAAGDENQE
ncbi:MAG: hypothetical protein BWX66_01333 [Deltaproteobacteria bacterium ADurb.Bin058]|nr:MAG: hypothetical protein BWX66_01333 [Deltaproteobacteria bacterium ADurb.Bin058]